MKDKQRVHDEALTDRRMQDLLAPATSEYHALVRAYRALVVEDFEVFIQAYVEAGRDINAGAEDGSSFTQLLASHAQAGPYLAIAKAAGGA